MIRLAAHLGAVVVLTVLTQLGGLAWIASRWFRRPLLAFAVIYACLWGAVQDVAPLLGRVPVPCDAEGLRERSLLTCAMMRNFVVPEVMAVAEDAAATVAAVYPGSVTLALDGSFPFGTGFPLLPHLSHDDGEKLDLAFYYQGEGGYAPGRTRSPLGYFAFEALDAEDCPPVWPTLRWRLEWLQGWFGGLELEPERTSYLVRVLLEDPRVGKVFVEPALAARLGLADPKLRFQGCRAARHDDHIHIQL